MDISEEPFFELPQNDWVKTLEKNHLLIKEELISQIKADTKKTSKWSNTYSHYASSQTKEEFPWKTFEFFFFGIQHIENCEKYPKTTELLLQIPELITAQFSMLLPKTKIKPHQGYSKLLLRNHLPLILPEKGDMGMKIKGETRTWEKGKLLSFNDGFIHEAWNLSDQPRTVLLFDIAHPECGYTAKEICEYKINTLKDSYLLNIAPKDQWKKWLQDGYFS